MVVVEQRFALLDDDHSLLSTLSVATASVPIVDVALGFRPHTGWTVAVAVGGDVASPQVVDRRVLPLTDEDHIPAQIYHAAVGLELAAAEKLVRRAEEIVTQVTEREVASFLAALRTIGHTPLAAGIATTAGGPETLDAHPEGRRHADVGYVLAAHMRMHAAEGELYGEALADALHDAGVMVTRVHPRDVTSVAVRGLQRDAESLLQTVNALGVPLGPPWRKDEKEATLLAWAALAEWRSTTN